MKDVVLLVHLSSQNCALQVCGLVVKRLRRVRQGACCDACHAESQCTDWFVSQGSCASEPKPRKCCSKGGAVSRLTPNLFFGAKRGWEWNLLWWGTQGRTLSRCNFHYFWCDPLPAFALCQTQRYDPQKSKILDAQMSFCSWMKHISLTI